jgi:hypothetical protein
MRSSLFALSAFALIGASLGLACSANSGDDAETSEAAVTDEELAKKAIAILGGKVEGAQQQCQRCHDVNQATLKKWADDYRKAMEVLKDDSKTADERISWMRRDVSNEGSTFSASKIGFLAAGAHLGGASVSQERHPTTYEHSQVLKKLFEGKDDAYKGFRRDTLMPVEPEYDRLAPGEYETIMQWVDKGMPKLAEMIPEEPRPTSCTDDFTQLRAHAIEIKNKSWESQNIDARVPMFACDASDASLDCFSQKRDGKDIFPSAATLDYAKSWAINNSTVRILRELQYKTYFWMRQSADGRFVANGVSGGGEDRAAIADLAPALTGGAPRDIWATASYDPDFWPDNKGFMFQGTSNGATFCAQSLLENPATTRVSFNEPQCSKLNSVGLYQSVGQRVGDNSIADHFVINGKFASDDPGRTARTQDLVPTFGPDAKAIVRVMLARGNDAEAGYEVVQSVEMPTPFEGDIMMSRSATLLGARVAGEGKALGYSIRKLSPVATENPREPYRFSLKPVGRVCMVGNKANFSFDERFLVTHHYTSRDDFASDEAYAPYKEKGTADLFLADFVTGKKVKITNMMPGQIALFPHFRSDGWIFFLVRDANLQKDFIVASDAALRMEKETPTP